MSENIKKLDQKHREELYKSGLTDETIEKWGCRTVSDDEARELLSLGDGDFRKLGGLWLPYNQGDDYGKVKPDMPGGKPGYSGDHDFSPESSSAANKGPKYQAPKEEDLRYFVPAFLCSEYSNRDRALFLVEGEKKAALLAQEGIPAICLPGVHTGHDLDAWDEGRLPGLADDIKQLCHRDRDVVVMFDSGDMISNEKVIRAAVRTARLVGDVEARPLVGYINGTGKGGVDDWYVVERESNPTCLKWSGWALQRPAEPAKQLTWAAETYGLVERGKEAKRMACWARVWFERDRAGWKKWVRKAEKTFDRTGDEIRGLVSHLALDTDADLPAEEFFGRWVKKRTVTYDYGSQSFKLAGEDFSVTDLINRLRLDANKVGFGGVAFLENALGDWCRQQDVEFIKNLKKRLAYKPAVGSDPVSAWVFAVTGDCRAIDVAVVRHFVWQVKQKMHGQKVYDHLMPILVGKGGGGKSEAVWKLLSPVIEVLDKVTDVQSLCDERGQSRFVRNYVCFADEMAKADRVDVAALKNVITTPVAKWRVLGTNQHATGPNNCTFIGCSNWGIDSLIYDPTGVRRFYQIDCLDVLDWSLINSIDYVGLWASVSESEPCPLNPHKQELKEKQEGWRVKDPVEEWVEEYVIADLGAKTSAKGAHEHFARVMGSKMSKAVFGKRLTSLLGGASFKSDGKMFYKIRIRGSLEDMLEQAPTPSETRH